MNVLSLFDGMSCGQIALDKLGIKVDNYYASEIDKYAIKVAKTHYPNMVHLGDVRDLNTKDLPQIDLLMGGSPCQGFSFAGKQLNFDDPRSKLFFDFIRIRDEVKPKYILLENVRMAQKSQDVISQYVGFGPQPINSKLLSAQNRYRLYWWGKLVGDSYIQIPIPSVQDKGIVMRDILEDEPHEFTVMSDRFVERQKDVGCLVNEEKDKARCLSAGEYVKNGRQGDYIRCDKATGKPNLIKSGLILAGHASDIKGHGYNRRVYHPDGKAPSLCAASGGNLEPKTALSETAYRKLTPIECERLQTLPDNYTDGVSKTQRYKMLGNGWTVDVIKHILNTAF